MLGTDPEFLIVDSAGRPVPAHKAGIPDKKHKMVLQDGESWAFRDGYMAELNILPNPCRQTLTFRVQRALQRLQERLDLKGYKLRSRSAVRINLDKDMKDAPEDVKQFGCEPSFDAYTGETKTPPIDAMTHPWRYAGGHVHFSGSNLTARSKGKPTEELAHAVKLMDLYIGLPLTCLFANPFTYQRRKFYGQAGEFRPQTYLGGSFGLEYRTPGPEIWREPWVASLVLGIGRAICASPANYAFDKKMADDLQGAINTGYGKWKLLRAFPGVYTPADVRRMAARAPRSLLLMQSSYQTVADGFAQWFEKLTTV